MLILSRKPGETIELPSLGVKIRITAIKKSRTIIGVDAPGEVEIVRGEKVDQQSAIRSLSLRERSLNEQLIAFEAEVIALAEMASDEHRHAATMTARESLQRLRKLRREQECHADSDPKRLGEFVAVRSEVLDHLRRDQLPADQHATNAVVRQTSVGYTLDGRADPTGSSERSVSDQFNESDWDEAGYQVA